jgi:diaminohydroxyphosphoribosylaminopyrimidine deaminase/5-amino-6-(5-phosphoribosylamino)uracil reductase
MAEAVELAVRGLGHTAPNPAVGCVLVKAGRVVGRGYHRRAGLAHAEAEALRDAGRRARGATAYVTLEPCSHHGRTPPCADALIDAGVARVVVGARDPNLSVGGKGLKRLRAAGVDVRTRILSSDCQELIRGFRSWVETGKPWVHLKLASTLDGRIAARGGDSKWISSPASRTLVQRMRARSDAILVGVGTVRADDPRLTCRLAGSRDPVRVILDDKLLTPTTARVVRGRGGCLIAAAAASPTKKRRLEGAGAEILDMSVRGKRGWHRLLRELGRRGMHELLVEGGSGVATSLIRAGMVNSVTIFYNPRFMGSDGVPLVGGLAVRSPARALRMSTQGVFVLGDDIVWTGKPE